MCVQYITINLFSGEEEEVEVEVEVEGGSEVEFHSIDDGDGEEGEEVEKEYEDKQEESERIQGDVGKEETRVEYHNLDHGLSTSKRMKLMITNLGQRLGFLSKK